MFVLVSMQLRNHVDTQTVQRYKGCAIYMRIGAGARVVNGPQFEARTRPDIYF